MNPDDTPGLKFLQNCHGCQMSSVFHTNAIVLTSLICIFSIPFHHKQELPLSSPEHLIKGDGTERDPDEGGLRSDSDGSDYAPGRKKKKRSSSTKDKKKSSASAEKGGSSKSKRKDPEPDDDEDDDDDCQVKTDDGSDFGCWGGAGC